MSGVSSASPLVAVIMGSKNDFAVMRAAVDVLREFGVAHEVKVVSAHRTPELMFQYANSAAGRGLRIIIAGAGGAAHLPGMVAANTVLPVLGVPIAATALQGFDALLSIVQMPKGIPVGTLAIGASGAANAGLLAVQMLATTDAALQAKLAAWRDARRDEVLAQSLEESPVSEGLPNVETPS
jgi:5-(carboxyamino)imidazole ribonucleotide mutase